MQITGPSPASFGPQTAQVVIVSIAFDMVGHTYTVFYAPAAGASPNQIKSCSGATPGAILTALETKAQAAVEANEGWIAGSSTVTQT